MMTLPIVNEAMGKLSAKEKELVLRLNDAAVLLHIHGVITDAERSKTVARLCKMRDKMTKGK